MTLHCNFKSKFALGELVEYIVKKDQEHNFFGHVTLIEFWKSDAVNYAASYPILKVNSQETDRSIPEHQIKKSYGVR